MTVKALTNEKFFERGCGDEEEMKGIKENATQQRFAKTRKC
jgi:hypothetical protein